MDSEQRRSADVELMLAWALGELGEAEAAGFAARLAGSPALARQAEGVRKLVESMQRTGFDAPPAGLRARAIEAMQRVSAPGLVARLASALGETLDGLGREAARLVFDGVNRPELAGFRGSGVERHLAYSCEAGEIDMEVIDEAQGAGEGSSGGGRRLRGQIAANGAGALAVFLLDSRGEGLLARAKPDARGRFEIVCEPGVFDLVVRFPETLVTVSSVEVP
jgi:hypothetical protein